MQPKDTLHIPSRNWASISTVKLSSAVRPTYPSLWSSVLLTVAVIYVFKKDGSPSSLTFSLLLGSSIIFLLITTARITWACFVYPRYRSPLRHLPQPPDKPSFLMGHFWQMMESGPGDVLRSWANSVPNQGLIRYLDFFNLERVAIVGPAALADVLVHNCYDFEKPPQLRKGISRILGLGLFLSEGEVHRRQRKYLMPAFAYRHVKNLYPMFWNKSTELVAAIVASTHTSHDSGLDKNVSIEVNEWASRATLDIIGQGGFGQSFNAIQDPDNALSRTYRSMFKPGRVGQILGVLGFLLPQWLVRRLPFLRNDTMQRSSNFLRAFCRSSIESKRQKPNPEVADELDILTVAMHSGAFSDEDLVDQMMTFLAAGHETTASALTWAIYLLAKHPQIQDHLRDEVHSLLPNPLENPDAIVTSETIEKMPYLNIICREILRLFPPVAVTIRVAVKDTTICGQYIPEGTTIMIPPWAVNGNTELWGSDAGEFKPERWQRSASGSSAEVMSTNYQCLTFSHGPRSCIGQSFAMGEFQCLVAAWVGAFETELQDPDFVPVIKGGITAKPRDGLHARVRPVAGVLGK
ncbi:MAG: hypothetical protein L6R38_002511 [Xanthoria sp. 2 TBL-2021]|nr:MAG: hypothetical protein L6R38_002511 [Xanthoria sp. 2 TBL-2021]